MHTIDGEDGSNEQSGQKKKKDLVKELIRNWVPQVLSVITLDSSRQRIFLFVNNQPVINEVFQTIRRKNMGEIVPADFKKRNDFVLRSEFRECVNSVGEKISFDLKDLYTYFVVNVQRCKPP